MFNNYSTISPPRYPYLLSWKQWIYSTYLLYDMYQKFSYCWLSSLSLSHRQHFILIWRVATDFLIWTKLHEVIYLSEVLKMKIHMNWCRMIFRKQALNGFHSSFCFPVTLKIAWVVVVWVKSYLAANCLYSRDEYGSLLSDTTS